MSERTEKDDPDSAAACPICGGSAALAYTAGDYHYGIPGRFSVHRCGQCQHLFQWPMPSEDELGWYYPGEYYSFQPPTVDARPHALRRRGLGPLAHYAGLRRGYRHLRRFPNPLLALLGWRLARLRPDIVLPRFVAGGTLCDFGCGAGANVAVMQYLGWNASGIDASATAAAAGRRAGLNIIEGSAEVLECRPEAFDAIVAAHSVEHVPDAARLFGAFYTALKPGGTLAIEVPNAAAAALALYGQYYYYLTLPLHVHIFSPSSLRLLAQRHGFTEIATRTASRWRTHAASWLVRRDVERGKVAAQFKNHPRWQNQLARIPALIGYLRSLQSGRGDCLQLVCRRPAEPGALNRVARFQEESL